MIICELGGRAPYGVGGFVPGDNSVANGCLSLGPVIFRRGFLRRVLVVGERDLVYGDSDLNESTHLWWRFSDTTDRTVSLTPQVRGYLDYWVIIKDFNIVNRQRQKIFT